MAGGGQHGGKWDFFISYTQADRRWAEWIAWVLEEHGRYQVLVQAWDFVPGSNWIADMQAGTQDAARTIAVLSEAYLDSQYGSAEWQAAWAADPDGAHRKLLTARVADCARPGLLAGVVGVDVFGLDEPAARVRLLGMVAAAEAGRAKPTAQPPFPGAGRAVPDEPHFPGGLPRIWGGKMPPRNPNFTGREEDLGALRRGLTAGSRVMVHSVRGMGGIGKTQLAAEYAYAHARDYDLVWWVITEEPAAIPDQFTALAARLGLNPATEPDARTTGLAGQPYATRARSMSSETRGPVHPRAATQSWPSIRRAISTTPQKGVVVTLTTNASAVSRPVFGALRPLRSAFRGAAGDRHAALVAVAPHVNHGSVRRQRAVLALGAR